MKKAILTTLVSLLSVAALGQGSVTFQNASTISDWNPVADRNVKFGLFAGPLPPGVTVGQNVSSNASGLDLSSLRAALYYAPGTVQDSQWWLVNNLAMPTFGSPYATFKQSTSSTAGSWFGGSRTMAGVPTQGGVASLMVVVFDSRATSDPFFPLGIWGRSAVFSYTTPTSGTPAPAEFLMNNLQSFQISYGPEPTTTTLLGLGAATIWFRKRCNRKS